MKRRGAALLAMSVLAATSLAALPVPARADAAAGYTDSVIAPVSSATPPTGVSFGTDRAGDIVDQVEGSATRPDGEVYDFPAGSDSYFDLGTSAGTGVSVAGGWVSYVDGTPAAPATDLVIVHLADGARNTVTLAGGQSYVGMAGNGDLLVSVGGALDLLAPSGAATTLASGSSVASARADDNEVIAAFQTSSGYVIDHVDISAAKPAVVKVGTSSDAPGLFITPATYGWDDPSAKTLNYLKRSVTTTPAKATLPAGYASAGMTDGTTASWVDASGQLGVSPLTALADRTALPTLTTTSAAFGVDGLVFAGGDNGKDFALLGDDPTASDYADLDDIGGQPESVTALGLGGGRLVRWGQELASTPISDTAIPVQSGDTSTLLAAPAGQLNIRVSGSYTAVPANDAFTVLDGSQQVFTSPADSQIVDLYGQDLTYTVGLTGQPAEHVRDLVSGADVTIPNGTVGGGGILSALSGSNVLQMSEIPSATSPIFVPLPATCSRPTGLFAAFRYWVELSCNGQLTVVNTLSLQAHPVANDRASLGDGFLVRPGNGEPSQCVSVQVLSSNETVPTCIGEAADHTLPVIDDTGGSVAWVDSDDNAHVVKVLPDDPTVGPVTQSSTVAVGGTWNLSIPVSVATTWALTVRHGLTPTVLTGSSPAGAVAASYTIAATETQSSLPWTLAATTPTGRQFVRSGTMTISQPGQLAPVPPSPAPPAAPAPKAPHLTLSLGKVKTVHGVTRVTHGSPLTVTASKAGSVGCVRVLLQKLVKNKWRTIAASKCLSSSKKSATKERLAKTGSYRIEITWSLARNPLKTFRLNVI